MGYLHIENLYKCQDILLFRECYALEKVHGTSAHVRWGASADTSAGPCYFSGGESHDRFKAIFDHERLCEGFIALGHADVTVYGEAHGGRCQGMKKTYGNQLQFIAFDVQVGDHWLSVPDAVEVCHGLGIEFVPYVKMSTDLTALDAERDRPSMVALRRGLGEQYREGIVLRPLIEVTKNNGSRIIAKHKRAEFSECATPQKVVDPAKLEVFAQATAIAEQWVTLMRLSHVLDKLPHARGMEHVRDVIAAMVDDVYREGKGEIVESREAISAIGRRTAALFKERLNTTIRALGA